MAMLSARRLISTSSILLVMRVVGAGLGLVLQVVLARVLAAQGLGLYYIVVSLVSVAGVLGAFGYPVIANRFVARYRSRNADGLRRLFVGAGLTDTWIVSASLAASVALGALVFVEDRALAASLALGATAIPPLAVARFATAVSSAEKNFYISYLPELVGRPAALLACIGALLLAGTTLSVLLVVGLYVALSWAIAALQVPRVKRAGAGSAPLRRAARMTSHWRKLAGLLLVMPVFTTMLADLDILALAPLMTSGEIGVFGAALKMVAILAFAVQILHQIVVPDMAEAAARGRLGRSARLILLVDAAATVFTSLAALGVFLLGDRVLALFGPEFPAARGPLTVIALSLAFRAAGGPATQLLVVIGRERAALGIGVGLTVYLLAANVVLVPWLGVMGAALAFASMNVVSCIVSILVLRRAGGLGVDLVSLCLSACRSKAERVGKLAAG